MLLSQVSFLEPLVINLVVPRGYGRFEVQTTCGHALKLEWVCQASHFCSVFMFMCVHVPVFIMDVLCGRLEHTVYIESRRGSRGD